MPIGRHTTQLERCALRNRDFVHQPLVPKHVPGLIADLLEGFGDEPVPSVGDVRGLTTTEIARQGS